MGLDPVVECQSDHGCRQTRYDDLEPHDNFVQITVIVYKVLHTCKDLVVAWIGKIALAFRFAFAMKRPEIPEIDDDNRKDCTELDNNFKTFLKSAVTFSLINSSTRIMWPVLLIGSHSVMPSTIPSRITFNHSMMFIRYVPFSF